MITPNPFTPQSGWEPRFFGGRDAEIKYFQEILKESRSNRCNHMVILGEWGTGKTSLLKQYKKIAQRKGHLASFCPISKIKSNSLLKDTISLISEEMIFGFPKAQDIKDVEDKLRKRKSLQPQVQFTRILMELWESLNTEVAVVLLDDVQNFDVDSGVIDTLRSVLSKDEILKNTNYLFILSSTPKGWGDFVDKHNPVGRFFRKRVYLDNLTKEETFNIIDNTLRNTDVEFATLVIDKIYESTRGHPYELQLLCSHLYDSQIEGKVSLKQWESAFVNTLRELGRDYFDSLYKRASEREINILEILAEKDTPLKIAEFRSIMITEKRARNFPIANIKNFLYRLQDKELVKRKESGEFEILDPMFSKYLSLFK